MKLKTRLSLFNILSKLAFSAILILFLPIIIERISLRQIDNELIKKREEFINLISESGIEPFITSDSTNSFGSYNILKEEYISLERSNTNEVLNYIEVTPRIMEGEEIMYRVLNYSLIVDGTNYLLEVGESLNRINNTEKNIRSILLVFLAIFILVTWYADFQHTMITLKPLDLIIRKLKHISDPLQFERTPVTTDIDDFKHLDQALLSLMDNVNSLIKREREITINISHELLTPISVIRSKLENLLLQEQGNIDVGTKIEESLRTLNRLQSMVNSLLMIARIEGQQYYRDELVDITELLNEAIDELKPLADDKNIKIDFENKINIQMPEANRALLFSMINNILINAYKNTSSNGIISIRYHIIDKNYILSISDTGKGLTSDQMEKLFLRFKTRNEQSGEGTGIGLAIAKTIADFHNIKISVSSEIGKGTNISFIFPENS